MRLPEDARQRTRAYIKLAALSVVAGSFVTAALSVLAGWAEWSAVMAVPRIAVRVATTIPLLAGTCGAGYAMLQLPLPRSRRVAASLGATALASVASMLLTVMLVMIGLSLWMAFRGVVW